MSLSSEDQLILQCASGRTSGFLLDRALDLLQKDLNWSYILDASISHGVAPLLHHSLSQIAQTAGITAVVPSFAKQDLDLLYRNNLARNHRLYKVIGEICRALDRICVEAMGLKDLPLARTVFSDIGLRPIGDVDILIHKEDYPQVEECMADLGFTPLPSPDCPYILKYAWAIHLRRPADNVWVDMQWGVLQLEWDLYGEGNFDFEIDRLWRGARTLTIDDYEILQPRPEDMLFHLCMHLEGHRYAELILFCDIAELLRYYGDTLDWDYLIALAKKYHVETSIYYVLLFTEQLLGCQIPFPLQALEPDYFKANLFDPIFGNLTDLHGTLDDIYRSASPPAGVMTQFEITVRRQTALAIRWYEELDNLATTLRGIGAEMIVFDGPSSPMIFPTQALPPFPDIRLFVLEQDTSRLRQALLACGFERKQEQETDGESYYKHRVFASKDPATGGVPLVLEMHGQIIDNLEALIALDTQKIPSKKSLALQTIAGTLKHDENVRSSEARLHLVVLGPEEIATFLAARSGRRQHERLFGLCGFLELCRGYRDPLDWVKVAELAEQHGLTDKVRTGLLIANALLDQSVPIEALAHFDRPGKSPHMFQWARYGPAAMERYTSLKAPFFYVFTLLSIKGLKAKLEYLTGVSSSHEGTRAILGGVGYAVRLGIELFVGAFRGRKRYTARDLAYWTETEPAVDDLD
jgi:hypothetical protein